MIATGKLFIDADAFVALYNPIDSNHLKAVECFEIIEKRNLSLFTSELVLMEVSTVLTNKAKELSKDRIQKIIFDLSNSDLTVLRLESHIYRKAVDKLHLQTTRNINIFDCYHMTQVLIEGIGVIFSFDKGYKKNKFILLSDLV